MIINTCFKFVRSVFRSRAFCSAQRTKRLARLVQATRLGMLCELPGGHSAGSIFMTLVLPTSLRFSILRTGNEWRGGRGVVGMEGLRAVWRGRGGGTEFDGRRGKAFRARRVGRVGPGVR